MHRNLMKSIMLFTLVTLPPLLVGISAARACTIGDLLHNPIRHWPRHSSVPWKFASNFPADAVIRDEVRAAFDEWDMHTPTLTLVETDAAQTEVAAYHLPDIVGHVFGFTIYAFEGETIVGPGTIMLNFAYLTEPDVFRWAIRHEIGHLLGLQDTTCPQSLTLMNYYSRSTSLLPWDKEAAHYLYAEQQDATIGPSWAFRATDGVHVAWITEKERYTQRFEVYGKQGNQTKLLITHAAEGGETARFYEVVVPGSHELYEVREIETTGKAGLSSRPTPLEERPPFDIDALRTQPWTQVTTQDRSDPSLSSNTPLPTSPLPTTDYYFYSSRQDFLDAVEPVRSLYSSRGFTSTTILGSKDPVVIQAFITTIHDQAVAENRPRLPFIVLVGSDFSHNPSDPRNVVGTWILSGGRDSDAKLVDANGDDLPDLQWTRIVGTTPEHIANAVQAALYFYNGQLASQPRALFLSGDAHNCVDRVEPGATLDAIANAFSTKHIPVTMLHSRDFHFPDNDPSCYSTTVLQAKHDAFVETLQSGVTEIVGASWQTSGGILPGDFAQQHSTPVFNLISDAPLLQLFVAEFAGCGLGYEWSVGWVPSIMQLFLTGDPDCNSTAVAWFGNKSGGYLPEHLGFTRLYFQKRLAVRDSNVSLHQVYFETIRQLGLDYPWMREYLLVAGAYGWPVQLPDMASPPGPKDPNELEPVNGHGVLPRAVVLDQNVPNPFNPQTSIRFGLPATAQVELSVYDVQGRLVKELVPSQVREGGFHTVVWDGSDDAGNRVASGVYFYRLITGETALTRKLVMLK